MLRDIQVVSTHQSPPVHCLTTEYAGLRSFSYSLCSIGLGVITTSSRCDTYNLYCPSFLFKCRLFLEMEFAFSLATRTCTCPCYLFFLLLQPNGVSSNEWRIYVHFHSRTFGRRELLLLCRRLMTLPPVVALNLGVVALVI
jgi:hypothetical protein